MEGSHEPESVLGVLLPVAMLPIGVHDRGSLARIMQCLAKLQRQLLFGRATTVQVLSRNKLSLAGKPCPQINLSWVNCTVLVQKRPWWLSVAMARAMHTQLQEQRAFGGRPHRRKQAAQTGANRIRWIRISETFSFLNWAKLRYAAMPSYSKLCQAMPSCLESGCGIKELLCSQLGISREPVESGKINGALATPW